ncbi:MAG: cytochrome c maturation protein CcmE [Alphaproteobacteria bacterium]|jgi:cytochrome c-type biogenesis protein CcmE|nr:cytochrome c maturation protein CcmE [Alphaproteobacteria bacterium]
MRRKRQRLTLVGLILLGVGAATALTLTAFEDNILFFYSPSDVDERGVEPGRRIRLGGVVAEDSVGEHRDGVSVRFTVTDWEREIDVVYAGLLPDLFRECQGVVAEGTLGADGIFVADQVLAKHDENYMPPEVAESLQGDPLCGDPLQAADRHAGRAAETPRP